MERSAKRPRIIPDVQAAVRGGLRLAAAKRDATIMQYVLEAIEGQLREDLGDEGEGVFTLTAKGDPLLAELWGNARDAAYERL